MKCQTSLDFEGYSEEMQMSNHNQCAVIPHCETVMFICYQNNNCDTTLFLTSRAAYVSFFLNKTNIYCSF